jgi:HEAT repeat protein
VKELQKTCDLLKLALETSASKETLPTPIDSKPKIIDYDKTMRSLNVNEHIRALSDLSRDNRHMHVQHLALFITEDNRESILDILLQFKKDWSPLVRENIYYQLGMHGYKEKPSLIKTLLNGLKDFYPPAQLSAAKALIRLHGLTPEVIETLLSLTQSSVKKISNKAMKLLNLNT